MRTTYHGERAKDRAWVRRMLKNGREETLRPPAGLARLFGPTFCWGDNTKGSLLLAATLLAELRITEACALYLAPAFCDDVISHLPWKHFELPRKAIRFWLMHREEANQ